MSKMNKTSTDFVKSSINTTSTALNGQAGQGAVKPIMSGGKDNPGGTKPPMAPETSIPMPK